jgi:hypothetical protein
MKVNNELGGGGVMFLCGKVVALCTQKKTKLKWFVIYFWFFFLKNCQKKKCLGFWKNVVTFKVPPKAFCHSSVFCKKNCIIKKKMSPSIVKSTLGYSPPIPIAKKWKKPLSGCCKFGKMETFEN